MFKAGGSAGKRFVFSTSVGAGRRQPRASGFRRWNSKFPHEIDETAVRRDVILFRYENARFYRILNYFALSQLVFWTHLSYFGYTSLRDVKPTARQPQPSEGESEDAELDLNADESVSWWRKINMGDPKFRIGFAIISMSIGCTVFLGSLFFTRRSVRTLTLLRGGRRARLVCYSPWTRGDRILEVPLEHLNCSYSRLQRGHLPIQVFGYRLYFLLDNDGEFTNTKLFDYTAGLHRSWKM